jgi:hypothetical protein
MSIPFILAKKKQTNLYIGVYVVGKGAWKDLIELKKRASNNKEAIEWFLRTVPNKSWGKIKYFKELSILPNPIFEPSLAGQDELQAKDNYYIIENGFELSFACNENGEKGCWVEYNEGTRNKPKYSKRFIKLNPRYSTSIQHRAGRGGWETLHLEKISDEFELVIINDKLEWNKKNIELFVKVVDDNFRGSIAPILNVIYDEDRNEEHFKKIIKK